MKGTVKKAIIVSPDVADNPVVAAKVNEMDQQGSVTFSSADFADFAKGKEAAKPKEDPMATTSSIPVNTDGNEDRLTSLGKTSTPGELDTSKLTVTVTPNDKAEFLQALVTGGRFSSEFTMFNGKIRGVFRSRRQNEAIAIFNQMAKELSKGDLRSGAEQVARIRYMLLSCQLAELNGTKFEEAQEPLNDLVGNDGKVTPPTWLGKASYFESLPEGLVTALFTQLCEFEAKYWTMVNNAKDQNFWKPEKSS